MRCSLLVYITESWHTGHLNHVSQICRDDTCLEILTLELSYSFLLDMRELLQLTQMTALIILLFNPGHVPLTLKNKHLVRMCICVCICYGFVQKWIVLKPGFSTAQWVSAVRVCLGQWNTLSKLHLMYSMWDLTTHLLQHKCSRMM